jgi:hypothetical protein
VRDPALGIAGIQGTGISVVDVHGIMNTVPCAGVAEIHGARIAVIAVLRGVGASGSDVAPVGGAEIAVVACVQIPALARHRVADIVGTRVLVIAGHRLVDALSRPGLAVIDGAQVSVVTGLDGIQAGTGILRTGVLGAGIPVVAVLLNMEHPRHGVASVRGTQVGVVHVKGSEHALPRSRRTGVRCAGVQHETRGDIRGTWSQHRPCDRMDAVPTGLRLVLTATREGIAGIHRAQIPVVASDGLVEALPRGQLAGVQGA